MKSLYKVGVLGLVFLLLQACSSKPTSREIERDEIDAAFHQHRDEYRACYEREASAVRTKIEGKVVASFSIDLNGRAQGTSVKSSTLHNSNVEQCVLKVIAETQFPKPQDGVPITITYPFSFSKH